ncbi:pyruvate dehydrogenase complex dihydrolipoamide acetyltransferase [Pseudomonadota bacterium]|nr:pyruvate dehydrogenase complex dihydrolipoamide acetyltransferase [Alphaproteobacteria bacterium]MDC1357234.1 pyruvate dehydrogenase complex dihydrolipoamide acetyltransferase [Pseudomonadota bacterium]
MSLNILMPALSPTMEEGTLSKWLVKEGDIVTSGDLIAEIETDKATMEVESIDDGTIGKILVNEGQESIKVNEPIAILLLEGETLSDIESMHEAKLPEVTKNLDKIENKPKIDISSKEMAKIELVTDKNIEPVKQNKTRIFVSPLAKRLAKQRNIDLSLISGSGANGRILKNDIENFNNNKNLLQSEITLNNNKSELVKNSSMRKTIAERLVQSKNEAPHFYLSLDCNIDQLLKIRSLINLKSNDQYKISVNDMIIKAASSTLIKVPQANASWENENTRYFKNTDISVAVAIDGGLITPIIKNVQSKGLLEISEDMKILANKAKSGKLLPEEYIGGSFSISNLGMYGIKEFSAVINPPQGAILAVGSGEKRPIVINDQITIANMMTVTLSCDHRVVDGAVGAEFLSVFKDFIENPSLMLL